MMAVTAGTATAATAAATRGTGGTGVAGTGAGTGATGGVADHSRDAMGCKGMQDILDASFLVLSGAAHALGPRDQGRGARRGPTPM